MWHDYISKLARSNLDAESPELPEITEKCERFSNPRAVVSATLPKG